MGYIRNDIILGYGDLFIGGYSLKTGKVYYVPRDRAKTFNHTTAMKFIAMYVCEKSRCDLAKILIIKVDWRLKFIQKNI